VDKSALKTQESSIGQRGVERPGRPGGKDAQGAAKVRPAAKQEKGEPMSARGGRKCNNHRCHYFPLSHFHCSSVTVSFLYSTANKLHMANFDVRNTFVQVGWSP
jgi:hypothetical protein